MIDRILSLPAAERDDEIRKLICKGPWKHEYKVQPPMLPKGLDPYCLKCKDNVRAYSDCTHPDPIALDWNLAMKMRDEAVEAIGKDEFEQLLFQVFFKDRKNGGNKYSWQPWLIAYCQPHHYILAALLAKEGE